MGAGRLENGLAKIEVPEEFVLTAEGEGINVQVTLREPAQGIYGEEASLEGIVVRELARENSDARFDFLVTAVRR